MVPSAEMFAAKKGIATFSKEAPKSLMIVAETSYAIAGLCLMPSVLPCIAPSDC